MKPISDRTAGLGLLLCTLIVAYFVVMPESRFSDIAASDESMLNAEFRARDTSSAWPSQFAVPRNGLIWKTISLDRNIERFTREVLFQYSMGIPEEQKTALARFIIREARAHNFDPFFILAVIFVESHLDTFAVSSKGALGLMQIMPRTGAAVYTDIGLTDWKVSRLFDPFVNVKLGITYLDRLKRRFHYNVHHLLVAYNEGPSSLSRRLKRRDRVETEYSRKILAYYHHFAKHPDTREFVALALRD